MKKRNFKDINKPINWDIPYKAARLKMGTILPEEGDLDYLLDNTMEKLKKEMVNMFSEYIEHIICFNFCEYTRTISAFIDFSITEEGHESISKHEPHKSQEEYKEMWDAFFEQLLKNKQE